MVCLYVSWLSSWNPCKNVWTDQDVIWESDSGRPKEPWITGCPNPQRRWGTLWGLSNPLNSIASDCCGVCSTNRLSSKFFDHLLLCLLILSTSSSISDSPIPSPIISSSDSPLCSSITPSRFYSRFKTYLFRKSYPVVSLFPPGLPSPTIARTVFLSYSVLLLVFFLILYMVPSAFL